MGEAHLARPGRRTPAGETRGRDRMVRRPEWTVKHQRLSGRQEPRNGKHGRHFKRLLGGERGKDSGHPAGQHRLSGARWAHQKEIVPPGGGDLQRTLDRGMSANFAHLLALARRSGEKTLHVHTHACPARLPTQQGDDFAERCGAHDRHRPGPSRRLSGVFPRHDEGFHAPFPARRGHR